LSEQHNDNTFIETIQSLVVAFVLAMTFRGFVVEGFVIPTGSMAPTLLGQHFRLHSDVTGSVYAAGLDASSPPQRSQPVYDPMLGPDHDLVLRGLNVTRHTPRMGDRILVLKCLYPFFLPDRFDVVVFKNPTDPRGEAGNYIKRLVGLPGESVWLVDGDVFVTDADAARNFDSYQVQRKPEHIQQAVWQPINNTDFIATDMARTVPGFNGTFWRGQRWDTDQRRLHTDSAEPTTLRWDADLRPIDDWTPYNMFMRSSLRRTLTSDVRIRASIVPERPGLTTTFQLEARSHTFEFHIEHDTATVRYRRSDRDSDDPDAWIDADTGRISPMAPGQPTTVEFWHVDQTMRCLIEGRCVAELEYNWTPRQRLQNATGQFEEEDLGNLVEARALPTRMQWRFAGSPVSLHSVRVDRDLHYRVRRLNPGDQRNTRPDGSKIVGWGFATHPDRPGVLGDEQYMMLGDNSTSSLDSRFWGMPHPLVIEHINDPSPFVVNRKLLIGKAWMVYFPSPYPVSEGGRYRLIPDFGRLRFIR